MEDTWKRGNSFVSSPLSFHNGELYNHYDKQYNSDLRWLEISATACF